MNKFIQWILGERTVVKLREENKQAAEDMRLSRIIRDRAERVGQAQRTRIERNHVGEGFRLAFEAGQKERNDR